MNAGPKFRSAPLTAVALALAFSLYASEPARLVSSRELQFQLHGAGASRLQLVDVRPADQFRIARIPGSLNLPLHTVKTRKFLRDKRVILVTEGYHDECFFAAIDQLTTAGFQDVWILKNGIRGWQAVRGQVEGESPTAAEVAHINPDHFARLEQHSAWLIVDVQLGGIPTQITPPSASVVSSNPETLLRDIRGQLARAPSAEQLLVVAPEDADYAQIESLITAKIQQPVFYLAGGWPGLEKLREQQRLIAQRREITLSDAQPLRSNPSASTAPHSGSCCGGHK